MFIKKAALMPLLLFSLMYVTINVIIIIEIYFMPRIINFSGEPSSGKSTAAGALFSHMKQHGFNVELVTEHAKLLSYQSNQKLLEDQLYVFSHQNSLLSILTNSKDFPSLDYIITDSPLYLSILYGKRCNQKHQSEGYSVLLPDSFFQMVLDVYQQYDNANILMLRNHEFMENQGRVHNQHESEAIKQELYDLLHQNHIDYITFTTQNLDNPNFNLGKQLFNLCLQNNIIVNK